MSPVVLPHQNFIGQIFIQVFILFVLIKSGEFNHLYQIQPDQWDMLEQMIRGNKKSKLYYDEKISIKSKKSQYKNIQHISTESIQNKFNSNLVMRKKRF